jgi:hypothetical protein
MLLFFMSFGCCYHTLHPFFCICSTFVVSAAILKVRTEEVAELVLIATHNECRKKVGKYLNCLVHNELCYLSGVI